MATAEKLRQKFIEQFLEEGDAPKTVQAFCKKCKIKVADFYGHYTDLHHLASDIPASVIRELSASLLEQETFRNYSLREKLLAFYFSCFEQYAQNRDYYLLASKEIKEVQNAFQALKRTREAFNEFISPMLKQAEVNAEIPERKFISRGYKELLWMDFIVVFQFWLKDNSKEFERTDALIEKTLNLAMNVLEQNTLDQLIDLGKFMFSKNERTA